jgi:hypothetical protein
VTSYTTASFWKTYNALPKDVQKQSKTSYKLFVENPYHPSLHFKCVHTEKEVYSVRANLEYRALGTRDNDEIVWFWIGIHADYEKILKRP